LVEAIYRLTTCVGSRVRERPGCRADGEHGAAGHKTVGAALRYQHSESGRDAIVAANLSANALADLAAAAEQIDIGLNS